MIRRCLQALRMLYAKQAIWDGLFLSCIRVDVISQPLQQLRTTLCSLCILSKKHHDRAATVHYSEISPRHPSLHSSRSH